MTVVFFSDKSCLSLLTSQLSLSSRLWGISSDIRRDVTNRRTAVKLNKKHTKESSKKSTPSDTTSGYHNASDDRHTYQNRQYGTTTPPVNNGEYQRVLDKRDTDYIFHKVHQNSKPSKRSVKQPASLRADIYSGLDHDHQLKMALLDIRQSGLSKVVVLCGERAVYRLLSIARRLGMLASPSEWMLLNLVSYRI